MCWKLIRKSFSLLLIMVPIALVYPTPGQAASIPQFQEFPGPLKATPPINIVAGTDGNIWFSQMNSSNVGRFNRKSGQFQKYARDCNCSSPMIALDKNNNLWASTDPNSFDVFASQTGQRTRYFDPLTTDSTFPQTEAQAIYPITRGSDGNIWSVGEKTIGRMTTIGEATDFSLPDEDNNGTINALTAGADGNIWFSTNNGHIGKITPLGEVTDYALPNSAQRSQPEHIISGPDGQIWFIDQANNNIERMSLQGIFTSYALPITISAQNLSTMASGPDGNLWLADKGNNQLLEMSLQGVVSATYQIPTPNSQPGGITFDTDGTLWFSETGTSQLGHFTMPSPGTSGKGQFQEFPVAGQKVDPWFILPGPKGDLWFSEEDTNNIGRITTSGQILKDYPTSPQYNGHNEAIGDMARGKDGNLWFEEGNDIWRMTPDGQLNTFSKTSPYGARSLTANTDGNIWFLTDNPYLATPNEQLSNQFGKITPEGKITTFSFPDTSSVYKSRGRVAYLTAGPNGTLWVTEPDANKIGRLTTQGQMTEFTIPSAPPTPGATYGYDQPPSSEPSLIVWGPDGNLWFLETNGNKLGRITPTGVFSEFSLRTSIGYPSSMVFGNDGNLWVPNGNSIARVTQQGITTIYPMKNYSAIAYITQGPDGNLWFTDQFRDEIGRIVLNNKSSQT